MSKGSIWKIVGFVAMAIGGIATVVRDVVADKEMEMRIDEKVEERLRLNEGES